MSRAKSKKEKYIAISDIAFNLSLLDADVEAWLFEDKPKLKPDHRNRQCVSENYLEKLSRRNDYEDAKRRSLESENYVRNIEVGRKEHFFGERKSLLKIYSVYISDLEKLHKSCLERVNSHNHESSITAAYMLFSKVISCLKMGVLTLENGYWYGGSVIREIDEALDLAHYFVISQETDKGVKHLHQWFRHNRAPQHFVCRDAIATYMSSLISEIEKKNHQDLMNELYQSKSKWTHPTYSSIREVTQFNTSTGISIENIEYGSITFETKILELVHFFRSSIWSAFQVFQVCFSSNLPLSDEEDRFIRKYDKVFQEW